MFSAGWARRLEGFVPVSAPEPGAVLPRDEGWAGLDCPALSTEPGRPSAGWFSQLLQPQPPAPGFLTSQWGSSCSLKSQKKKKRILINFVPDFTRFGGLRVSLGTANVSASLRRVLLSRTRRRLERVVLRALEQRG